MYTITVYNLLPNSNNISVLRLLVLFVFDLEKAESNGHCPSLPSGFIYNVHPTAPGSNPEQTD